MQRKELSDNRIDTSQGRSLFAERSREAVQRIEIAFDLNRYPPAVVQHKANQSQTHCLAVDKWPKTHALHNALYDDTPSL